MDLQASVVRATGDGTDSPLIGIAGTGGQQATLVKAVPAWQLVLVRAARAAIQVFLSSVGVGTTGAAEWALGLKTPLDFVLKVKLALLLAGVTAVTCALQNTGEFLAELDMSHPQLRG